MFKVILLITFWMFIVPIILGLGILRLNKNNNRNMALALILGFFAGLLLFETLSIPMTFFGASFNALRNTWSIGIFILAIVSCVLNRKEIKEILKINFEEIKKLPKISTISFLILLIIQCYVPFKYMHEDYDDSNFVAKAQIAIDTNSLFVYDDAGREYKEFPTRTVFSQFPHYTAVIATLSDIHPAILAHTIFPVIFVIYAYALYYVWGMTLFKNDYKKTMVFLNILSIIYIYGDYSRYTNFVRLLYRVWQGKSIVANITIPCIWYIFMEYIGKENNKFGWIILFLVLGGSLVLSSMAFVLPVIITLVLMVIYAIRDRKKGYILGLLICCIPVIILVGVYMSLDNPIVKKSAFDNDELTLKERVEYVIDGIESEKNLELIEQSYQRAGGSSNLFAIFCVSIVFIWVICHKERKEISIIFSVFSILILIINLNPIFSRLWSMTLGSGVHWRVYWMLPIGYAIAFMCTELIYMTEKRWEKTIAFIICAFVIILNGSNIYNEVNFAKVDNYYKVPDLLLEMIFNIQADESDYKKVGGPEEVSIYTRQIDGNILLAQNRNVSGLYSKDSLVTLVNEGDSQKIYDTSIKQKCNYIIMNKDKINEEDSLTEYGFEVICENAKYVLYKIDI